MKKINFGFLSLLALSIVGCTKFEAPVSEVYAEAPDVICKYVAYADSSVTFKLAVDTANAKYLAYSFYEGFVDTPDSLLLLKKAAGGNAVLKNVKDINWNGNEVTLTYNGLQPNTRYSLCAVASSPQGLVGHVCNVGFQTSDGLSPVLTKGTHGETLTLQFSEAIKEGPGKVKANYFAPYDENLTMNAVDSADIQVMISGNTATIAVSNVPAGAIVLVSWETAAFIDMAINGCNAQVTELDLTDGSVTNDCYIEVPNAPFKLEDKMAVDYGKAFVDWQNIFEIKYDKELFLVDEDEPAEIFMTYVTDDYAMLVKGASWIVADSSIYILAPKEMEYGSSVSVTIPAGAVCDIYGNQNTTYNSGILWVRSYGLTRDDILGVWDWSYLDGNGDPWVETTVITANPRNENGVFINNLWTMGSCVEGEFDGNLAVLTIYDNQLVKDYPDRGFYAAFVAADDQGIVSFQYNPSSDSFTSFLDMYEFGYAAFSSEDESRLAWLDYATGPVTLTRNTTEPTGFSRDMVLGDYVMSFFDAASGATKQYLVTIEADSSSECGLFINNFFTKGTQMTAVFDTITSQVVLPDFQYLTTLQGYLIYMAEYNVDEIRFDVSGDGSMVAQADGYLMGIYLFDAETEEGLGWNNLSSGDIYLIPYEQSAAAVSPRLLETETQLTYFNVPNYKPVSSVNRPIFIDGPAR